MKPIEEIEGLTEKGKAILKGIKVDGFIDEKVLTEIYENNKDFFNNPELLSIPGLTGMRIGKNILEMLLEINGDETRKVLEQYRDRRVSDRANAWAIFQGLFIYTLNQLIEVGLVKNLTVKDAIKSFS